MEVASGVGAVVCASVAVEVVDDGRVAVAGAAFVAVGAGSDWTAAVAGMEVKLGEGIAVSLGWACAQAINRSSRASDREDRRISRLSISHL